MCVYMYVKLARILPLNNHNLILLRDADRVVDQRARFVVVYFLGEVRNAGGELQTDRNQ